MTDRIDALTVILDRPTRIDDVAPIANAIKQMKGVIEVTPVVRTAASTAIAEQRIHHELYEKVRKVLEPPIFGWPLEQNDVAL